MNNSYPTIPAQPGWYVVYPQGDQVVRAPVVAWAIRPDGARPVTMNGNHAAFEDATAGVLAPDGSVTVIDGEDAPFHRFDDVDQFVTNVVVLQ